MACQLTDGPGQRRIFIVDGHPMFRGALIRLVSPEPDLTVCGEAGCVPEALSRIEQEKPHLVLADVVLPGRSGLELIKDLRFVVPDIPVLAISAQAESVYAERVLRAGGRGYINKQESGANILEAIRQVLKGQIFLDERTSSHILERFSGRHANGSSLVSVLTDRELEVLQMLGEGKDNHIIAAQLHLSIKTVDVHRGKIKAKLKLRNATELVCYAARWVDSQGSQRATSAKLV